MRVNKKIKSAEDNDLVSGFQTHLLSLSHQTPFETQVNQIKNRVRMLANIILNIIPGELHKTSRCDCFRLYQYLLWTYRQDPLFKTLFWICGLI